MIQSKDLSLVLVSTFNSVNCMRLHFCDKSHLMRNILVSQQAAYLHVWFGANFSKASGGPGGEVIEMYLHGSVA